MGQGASSWMHAPTYIAIRMALGTVMTCPPQEAMRIAGAIGRTYGGSRINTRRLQRAIDHLQIAFPDWTPEQRRDCAIGSYEHLFRLGAEVAYGPRLLTEDGWRNHIHVSRIEAAVRTLIEGRPVVLITGHCGNWEVLGFTIALLGFPMHALYRPLDSRPLDRWVRQTRARRGLILVDKFGAVNKLPQLMHAGAPAGFVADQNGGDRGVFVPFFNRLASTYKAIGLLAMQFGATVVCGCARHIESASELTDDPREAARIRAASRGLLYSMELHDVFGPAEWEAHEDSLFYLTARYRRAMEQMVRTAPSQYLWMHRSWRSRPPHERQGKPFPARLEAHLRGLPWLTEADIERIKDQSARDAQRLAETGATKLS